MRLLTEDRETIRMEDVVFTLNNIVDEIASMYAGSLDHTSSDEPFMEIDAAQLGTVKVESEEANLLARPDSPTLSDPTLNAISTGSSDSEDGLSLYSTSLESSPTSSGFTTPSLSPMSPTFIDDKGVADSDTVEIHPIVDVDGELLFTPGSDQLGAHFPQEPPLIVDAENTDTSAPILFLEVPSIKLEPDSDSRPSSWTPSLYFGSDSFSGSDPSLSSEQDGMEIIYQKSANPPVFLATTSDPPPSVRPPHLNITAPRLPPRPVYPRDSPPHLPALHSPALQSTPRLDQNEDWDTAAQTKRYELGAAHLARQRQWARMTITHASDLADPQDLPPCRPVDKYLAWNSYSSPPISPPRRRTKGAQGRRVHVGPRTLPCGNWDPERKGGAIDRWNNREVVRRERMKSRQNAEQDSKPKLKPVVPLSIDTSRDYGQDSGVLCEIQQEEADDAPVSLLYETGPTLWNEGEHRERIATEGGQDTMRLYAKNGKCVSSGPRNSRSGSRSEPKSSTSNETSSACNSSVDDPNTMRWCVKNGVRVSSQNGAPADPSSNPEVGPNSGVSELIAKGMPMALQSAQLNLPSDQKPADTERPYVPKKRSPLSRSLLPISAATMKLQLRTSGDALSVGKARRKFASMMF